MDVFFEVILTSVAIERLGLKFHRIRRKSSSAKYFLLQGEDLKFHTLNQFCQQSQLNLV
jgi:hypothetical protein